MITWILGRSGAGKTTYLKERLPVLAAEHRRVFYLVPEQSSMALERELSAMEGVQVVSFRRLCNEIFRRFGGVAGNYMSRSRETALIYRVLQEQQGALGYYRKVRPTMGFVSRLKEVFSELSLSGLQREQVLPLLEEKGRRDWLEKYRDLFLLYDAYRAALNEENRAAAEDLAAATAIAAERGFFRDAAVVIDGFFGFTGRQRELLEVLFGQSQCVYCALLLDPEDPALCFIPAKNELAALERLARRAGADQERVVLPGVSNRLQYDDLKHLEQHLFAADRPEPAEAAHIRLMAGKNIREELAMVAVDIAKKVREQGLRYKDFALIAGSLEEYGPVAETVFAKYGVPLFVDQGRPSLGKPLFSFVQSALRLCSPERYFRREDLLILLKTGLCGEDRDLVSRLENYCTLWQITGERLIREADWTQNPAGLGEMKEQQRAQLQELNALRRRVREPLLRFKERAAVGTGAALAEAIYGLLCDFRVKEQIAAMAEEHLAEAATGGNAWELQQSRRLSREYLQIFSVMTDILDDIYTVFGEQKISLYAMEELIGLCGEEAALNVAPPTLDAVTFGAVAHSRLEEVYGLYVVGANQGILPMPVADSGLIGDRERQLFTEHDLPCNATLGQNTLQGQYRLYAALFTAREELTFSYSAFRMDGENLNKSPYLNRLEQLFAIRPVLMEDLSPYDLAVTADGARDLMAMSPAFRAAVQEELGEPPLPERPTDDRLPEAVVRRIFGNHLRLSYSQISLYQNCPFHYFMEKTMGIRALEPITFDAANIGTFVHYGMEKLIGALREQNFNYEEYNTEKIQQFGAQMAREYLGDQLRDLNQTNRFNALYRRMTGLFCRVAENVLGELREGGYLPYGEEVSLAGHPLALAGGGTAELIGSVDRVDTFEQGGKTYLKVTDYKTGAKSFDLRGITNQDNVQLPIYLYGLMKSGKWEHPVPAAGCYMEARMPVFREPVLPEELEEKLKTFYKRGGFFSADPEALTALDAAGGSNYFKVRYTANGLRSDQKVYEPELVEELVDHMERVIKETAEGILSGEAAIRPMKGREHNACQYCDFAAVCRHTPEGEKRFYSEEPFGWREEAEQ